VRLLVVAADKRELRGILEQAGRKQGLAGGSACPTGPQVPRERGGAAQFVCQPDRLGVDWARRAKLGEHDLLLVANGAGAARAAAAVDRAAAVFLPEAIISTGFCGALEERLDVGSVVVGTEVNGASGRFDARTPAASMPYHRGVVLTIDHVAQTAAEKRSLRQTGASAVEMEAAAVGERSAALGVPFYCIKAVTDLAGEDMANDLNAALRSDGHFDTIGILGSIFCRPLDRLPELVRLRSRSVRAACALGDFFADCRF
jgi:adenosylhomocysteine nucleosidase